MVALALLLLQPQKLTIEVESVVVVEEVVVGIFVVVVYFKVVTFSPKFSSGY